MYMNLHVRTDMANSQYEVHGQQHCSAQLLPIRHPAYHVPASDGLRTFVVTFEYHTDMAMLKHT